MAETFAPPGSSFAGGNSDTSYQNMWGGYSNATPGAGGSGWSPSNPAGGWQTGGQQWSPANSWLHPMPPQAIPGWGGSTPDAGDGKPGIGLHPLPPQAIPGSGASNATDMANYWSGNPWQSQQNSWSPWFPQGNVGGVNPGSGAPNVLALLAQYFGLGQGMGSNQPQLPGKPQIDYQPMPRIDYQTKPQIDYRPMPQTDSYQSLIGGTPPSSPPPPPPPPQQQFPYQSPSGPQQQVSSANQQMMANMAPFLGQNYLNMNQYSEPGQSGFHGYY